MSDLFLLSEAQMAKISPYFPKPHGVPRVDDRKVISCIVYVLKNGLQWKDAPKASHLCIPPRRRRKSPATFCKTQYKQRHKVENMFAKLKDSRRIATRYDRRADIFIAAITLAAIISW